MAYFVAILTPNSARSYVMQSTLPTKGMRSIISTVSIILKDFLPSILLLMVIIVAVVIVMVIKVIVVIAIVGVVIVVAIIGVVVVVGVPSIIDLSLEFCKIVGVILLALDMAAVLCFLAVVRSELVAGMASKSYGCYGMIHEDRDNDTNDGDDDGREQDKLEIIAITIRRVYVNSKPGGSASIKDIPNLFGDELGFSQ
ncbi:hypothetical protein Tco_0041161 [Tanacetum coccineum]